MQDRYSADIVQIEVNQGPCRQSKLKERRKWLGSFGDRRDLLPHLPRSFTYLLVLFNDLVHAVQLYGLSSFEDVISGLIHSELAQALHTLYS
jgi:hypothetical protein